LRHEDIDLQAGTLKVRRTLWKGKVYPPKTKSSRRTIKLPDIALDLLRRTQAHAADGYLFPTSSGAAIDAMKFWRRHWLPVLRKAGLPQTLTYHQLRKGTASLLLNQNVPVAVVSKYLGHSNPSTVYRFYAGIIDGSQGMAAQGMDDALS
jgi:integrase